MKWLRKGWPYAILAVLLFGNAFLWVQREQVGDWWHMRGYTPPTDIAQLAGNDTMTLYARRLLYVNRPSLEDKTQFNKHCADRSEQTAVLGCYLGNRRGIYIYAVTDDRLSGVREVTAAHEMLHQAYDRLNSKERLHINTLLQDFYAHGLQDEGVKEKLDSYKKQSGVVLVNEMHSIFGTEVQTLPDELEQYYKQYFTDRSKVVEYRNKYQDEFTRRETLVSQYDSRLADLKKHIDNNKSTLHTQIDFLDNKEKDINQDVAAKDQAQYAADVQNYNKTVETYNALLSQTRTLVDQYNQIVNERNAVALQEQQLQQAIDSRLTAPATKQ